MRRGMQLGRSARCGRAIDLLGAMVLATAPLLIAGAPVAMAQSANGVGTPFELAYWQSVGTTDDPALYEAYLQQYPQGTFAALAKARLAALQRSAPVHAPMAPAVAAPVVAPAAAPAPAPVTASGPMLAMAVPVSVPGAPPHSGDANAALGQMLADLARSQQTPGTAVATLPIAVAAVSPVSARTALPPRPQMVAVPELVLPPGFCSAEERNRFHDSVYRPAVDAAKRNNDAAVAYLKQLQGVYDGYELGKDTPAMNALAAEARAYQADAAATFSQQAALVRAFDELMAVPVRPCAAAK